MLHDHAESDPHPGKQAQGVLLSTRHKHVTRDREDASCINAFCKPLAATCQAGNALLVLVYACCGPAAKAKRLIMHHQSEAKAPHLVCIYTDPASTNFTAHMPYPAFRNLGTLVCSAEPHLQLLLRCCQLFLQLLHTLPQPIPLSHQHPQHADVNSITTTTTSLLG